jgi:hypothetical protein
MVIKSCSFWVAAAPVFSCWSVLFGAFIFLPIHHFFAAMEIWKQKEEALVSQPDRKPFSP